ncbi:MAG: ABC transporter ATP-binding protein, partial [Parasporobacterium sp.]|nr:ABC transporter ATP-binding protein [Parasporobacterium sp.]
MKFIFSYMSRYKAAIFLAIFIKLIGTMSELLLPYILEHMIDKVVPSGDMPSVIRWGLLMFGAAVMCWIFNVTANRKTIDNAHKVSYDVRQDLFEKTANLSGSQFDAIGLPSLISRMTSDSYNVQSAAQQFQSICVRAPMMLLGGIIMTTSMDLHLALILIIMLPFLIAIVLGISAKGILMFAVIQQKLDTVVRVMRENITGIRVVKALSKTEYEKRRFSGANQEMMDSDIKANTIMALPGPLMQLFLNSGLALVIYIGAKRVDAGLMQPGVILAFLTYFNMIAMGVFGLNRIFMTMSRASASANRISSVMKSVTDQNILDPEEALTPGGPEFIRFEHVDFSYGEDSLDNSGFVGDERQKALSDISFSLNRGESLGIIGPTGCGKTTIINLLMRFYDAQKGGIFVDGRDVRTYDKDALHKKFGVVFQNDMVFMDSLRENINFGRGLSDEAILQAAADAQADEYIKGLDDGLDHMATIKGANLSGGQKQRLLVARALAGSPEILILDDSSSALDYRTDAAMR